MHSHGGREVGGNFSPFINIVTISYHSKSNGFSFVASKIDICLFDYFVCEDCGWQHSPPILIKSTKYSAKNNVTEQHKKPH